MPFYTIGHASATHLMAARSMQTKKIAVEEFSLLLNELYNGISEQESFSSFLSTVRELLGLNFASITLRPPEGADGGLLVINSEHEQRVFIDSHKNPYTDKYYAIDPMTNLAFGKVVMLSDLMSSEELQASEFYQTCMQPENLYHMAGVDLQINNRERFTVRFCRSKKQKNFTDEEKCFLAMLAPHIEHAVSTRATLASLHAERELFANAVSGDSIGTITLDEQCHVMHLNPVAEEILQLQDGLSLRQGKVHIFKSDLNTEFKSKAEQALREQRECGSTQIIALSIPRISPNPDYELIIKALHVDRYIEPKKSAHLMLFISDPEKKIEVSQRLLITLYGLTQSEASLAVLLSQGKNLDEASQELNIARSTTRAHLRAIFSKTGVNQQSKLVSLILNSLAAIP